MTRLGRPRSGNTTQCKYCGKEFYRAAKLLKRYCSPACHKAYLSAKRVNESDGTAKCARCKEWKPICEFVKGVNGKPHSYCKVCSRAWFEARRRRLGIRPRTPAAIAREKAREYKRSYNKNAFHARRAAGQFPGKWAIGKLLCEQDAHCAYCQVLLDGTYHIDHKQPVSRGGTNDIANLHLTCPRCNMRKGAMTHEEFLTSKSRRAVQWPR